MKARALALASLTIITGFQISALSDSRERQAAARRLAADRLGKGLVERQDALCQSTCTGAYDEITQQCASRGACCICQGNSISFIGVCFTGCNSGAAVSLPASQQATIQNWYYKCGDFDISACPASGTSGSAASSGSASDAFASSTSKSGALATALADLPALTAGLIGGVAVLL